jgi:hypothetical protein
MSRSFRFILNERQLTVLRRIAEGVEPVTSAEPHLARTVYALRDRGLVEAKRRAGRWAATITPAGSTFAATGSHPDETRPPVPAAVSRAPRSSPSVKSVSEPALDLAEANVPPSPVPVPGRLVRPHRLVESALGAAGELRPDETGRLRLRADGCPSLTVSRAALPRALRIVQAVYTEAERRGYTLVPAGGQDSGVALVCRENAEAVAVWEETDKSPHEPTGAELKEAARYSWSTPPAHDFRPSGRLRLEIAASYGTGSGRRRAWRDTTRRRVEDQLAEVFAELEVRADLAAVLRAAREAEKRDFARAAAAARVRAEAAFFLHAQRTALRQQVDQWSLARRLRLAADDMHSRLGPTGQADLEGFAWIGAAREYANALDDPATALQLPSPPVPTETEIQEFMPSRYRWR